MFVGLHALMAARLDTPELELSEDEGAQFMKAAQNVMRHYSVRTTQKTMDTIAFAGVCVGIYAPRFAALKMRQAMEREQTNKPQPNVFGMTGQPLRG
jgi:hypothetical protein